MHFNRFHKKYYNVSRETHFLTFYDSYSVSRETFIFDLQLFHVKQLYKEKEQAQCLLLDVSRETITRVSF